MALYTAAIKNEERNSDPKRTSAGRGTLGVSAKVYLDTNSQDIVGVQLWLREFRGEPRLQVCVLGNGYNTSRYGETLFDGSIEDFVARIKED